VVGQHRLQTGSHHLVAVDDHDPQGSAHRSRLSW
jgi:hypothetical protein